MTIEKIAPKTREMGFREIALHSSSARDHALCEDILGAASGGAEAPFLRPAEFSTHTATSTVALQHAVEFCEKQQGLKFDIVVELMCTNPMKTHEDIDGAIEKLIRTGADSVIGVSKLDDHHPARAKQIINDRIVNFCLPEIGSRRQDLKPDAFIRNGSIYALKRDSLMVYGIRFGSENSRPYLMPPEKAINIDSEIDLMLARVLIEKARPRTSARSIAPRPQGRKSIPLPSAVKSPPA